MAGHVQRRTEWFQRYTFTIIKGSLDALNSSDSIGFISSTRFLKEIILLQTKDFY